MEIILTDNNTQKPYKVTHKELAQIAVALHGGGWTVEQTAAAMEWLNMVVISKEPVEFEMSGIGFTIEVKADVKAEGVTA